MKKQIFAVCLLTTTIAANAQMTLQHRYSGSSDNHLVASNNLNYPIQVVNLLLNGKKYMVQNLLTDQVIFYNLDYSLWKTITVPTLSGYTPRLAYYASENLFKLDNKVDMAIAYQNSSSQYKQVIIDETGSIINTIDSSNILQVFNIGVDSFVAVATYYTAFTDPTTSNCSVYSLPGTIPCETCSNSRLGMRVINNGNADASLQLIPNPTDGQVRINYTITGIVVSATISITDVVGRLISKYDINSSSGYVTFNTTNMQNGIYYCTLNGNAINPTTQELVVKH